MGCNQVSQEIDFDSHQEIHHPSSCEPLLMEEVNCTSVVVEVVSSTASLPGTLGRILDATNKTPVRKAENSSAVDMYREQLRTWKGQRSRLLSLLPYRHLVRQSIDSGLLHMASCNHDCH